jgi:hypothetical protein
MTTSRKALQIIVFCMQPCARTAYGAETLSESSLSLSRQPGARITANELLLAICLGNEVRSVSSSQAARELGFLFAGRGSSLHPFSSDQSWEQHQATCANLAEGRVPLALFTCSGTAVWLAAMVSQRRLQNAPHPMFPHDDACIDNGLRHYQL